MTTSVQCTCTTVYKRSSSPSYLPVKHLKVVMYSYRLASEHVTLGRHVAIKLGLGHPITFLAMSVNMEFAAAPMKYVNNSRRAGLSHAGTWNDFFHIKIVFVVKNLFCFNMKYSVILNKAPAKIIEAIIKDFDCYEVFEEFGNYESFFQRYMHFIEWNSNHI